MSPKTPSTALERTGLWTRTFGLKGKKSSDESKTFYANHLLQLREKAAVLVGQIQQQLPALTVHDITHLDALWEMASLIAGPACSLTAAEGFVFGAAVLLHDAAMSLAAFPDGIDGLHKIDEWRDVVSMLLRSKTGTVPSADEIASPPQEIQDDALFRVLRNLHAKQAEQLPYLTWGNPSDNYLIDNHELRTFYGEIIGKIARSHGEPLMYVENELSGVLGESSIHDGGSVNGTKLALLLRCADAVHLDGRRAPHFQQLVSKPEGVSRLHWDFQRKLAKPRAEEDALVFTSGQSFSLSEADAWWVGYDAIQVADRELRESDRLLDDLGIERFPLRRVKGAESPTEIAKTVKVRGWNPVDAAVRISNVNRVVEMFGGEKLYGDDRTVVLRELLQNAADAVRALRKRGTAESPLDGEITVQLRESGGYHWLDVLDTGIGMSARTLTGTLLDFGKSFWSSDAVQSEFPGLMSSGLTPSGKFGIGFFSVFMVADCVKVTSRRYDQGHDQTRTLEFRDRLNLRPILREPLTEEALSHHGTRVSLRLRVPPYDEGGLLCYSSIPHPRLYQLKDLVGGICPCLDVTVYVVQEGIKATAVDKNDWLTIPPHILIRRLRNGPRDQRFDFLGAAPSNTELSWIRPIKHRGIDFGRGAIFPKRFGRTGMIVSQGFGSNRTDSFLGVMSGDVTTLSRRQAGVSVPTEALKVWATEQTTLISTSAIPLTEKMLAAGIAKACGADTGKLPIAMVGGKPLDQSQLKMYLKRCYTPLQTYFEVLRWNEGDECYPHELDSFKANPEILFAPEPVELAWAPCRASFHALLETTLSEAWGEWNLEENEEFAIGTVNSIRILRHVVIYTRKTG